MTLAPIDLPAFPPPPRPVHLWLLMGGVSPEHEVSLSSGLTVLSKFAPGRYAVRPVCIRRDGRWCLGPDFVPAPAGESLIAEARAEFTAAQPGWETATLPRALEEIGRDAPEVAFIVMHGPQGEDGRIQAVLEMAGINYTGSGVAASALAMDKARTLGLLRSRGVTVAPSVLLEAEEWRRDPARAERETLAVTGLPCVIKPNEGGSSVGLTIAHGGTAWREGVGKAFALDARAVLCERYLAGRELTCGVIEVPRGEACEAVALAPTEIIPREGEFFDYHCKYDPGASEEITPARLTDSQTREVQAISLRVHRLAGARGLSRTDFILTADGRPHVLEINTIPGMTPTSLLPQGAAARGVDYPTLLTVLVEAARQHPAVPVAPAPVDA